MSLEKIITIEPINVQSLEKSPNTKRCSHLPNLKSQRKFLQRISFNNIREERPSRKTIRKIKCNTPLLHRNMSNNLIYIYIWSPNLLLIVPRPFELVCGGLRYIIGIVDRYWYDLIWFRLEIWPGLLYMLLEATFESSG